jgi:hypothetical protein
MNRFLIVCMAALLVAPAFAQGKKAVKLDKCVVTGEALGEMGKPIDIAYKGKNAKYKGKIVKVCCGGCVGKVNKAQDKFFAQVYGK